jgi:hypothetical protein
MAQLSTIKTPREQSDTEMNTSVKIKSLSHTIQFQFKGLYWHVYVAKTSEVDNLKKSEINNKKQE